MLEKGERLAATTDMLAPGALDAASVDLSDPEVVDRLWSDLVASGPVAAISILRSAKLLPTLHEADPEHAFTLGILVTLHALEKSNQQPLITVVPHQGGAQQVQGNLAEAS